MKNIATEATLTSRLIAALKTEMPEAIIYKINDRVTVGIPDAVITYHGRTLWIEAKCTVGNRIRHHANWERQLWETRRLEMHGRCIFVIFEPDAAVIAQPIDVKVDRTYHALETFTTWPMIALFIHRMLEL